jgi:hypothetical protein
VAPFRPQIPSWQTFILLLNYAIRKIGIPHGIVIFHGACEQSHHQQKLRYRPPLEDEDEMESLWKTWWLWWSIKLCIFQLPESVNASTYGPTLNTAKLRERQRRIRQCCRNNVVYSPQHNGYRTAIAQHGKPGTKDSLSWLTSMIEFT